MNRAMRRTGIATISVIILLTGVGLAGDAEYRGAASCKMCHIKQYKSWEATHMASSFELLRPGVRSVEKQKAGLDPEADYTGDPRCLPCHTTGYGMAGGFVSLAETPDLIGVQCEACHGPGGGYLADDKMSLKNKEYIRAEVVAAGLVIPTAETCTSTCHNEKSPFAKGTFDFEARKTEGTHEHLPLKYQH